FDQVDLDTIRDRVREVVADLPNVAAAYLFGSALAGGFRVDSDIDIALFLIGVPVDSREADLIAGAVGLRLVPLGSHEFDVNVIDISDTLFAFRVISEGMPLQVNDEAHMAELMEKVSRAYAEDGYWYCLAVEEIVREAGSHEA
ncbi:MAG: nucleotidyltransferase domain-containing protein, partial [Firmicutes bacterium]|nr:nucleotidyltransferase domain-containing protein [Bacillota bacterium]